jgi:hypothetical protein
MNGIHHSHHRHFHPYDSPQPRRSSDDDLFWDTHSDMSRLRTIPLYGYTYSTRIHDDDDDDAEDDHVTFSSARHSDSVMVSDPEDEGEKDDDDDEDTVSSTAEYESATSSVVDTDTDDDDDDTDDDDDDDTIIVTPSLTSCFQSATWVSDTDVSDEDVTMDDWNSVAATTTDFVSAIQPRDNTYGEQRVAIIGATHHGKVGTFVRRTPHRILVRLDHLPNRGSEARYFAPHNVVFVPPHNNTDHSNNASHPNLNLSTPNYNSIEPPTMNATSRSVINYATGNSSSIVSSSTTLPMELGQNVHIVGGSYSGQRGIVTKLTPQRVAVLVTNDLQPRYLHPRNVVVVDDHDDDVVVIEHDNDDNSSDIVDSDDDNNSDLLLTQNLRYSIIQTRNHTPSMIAPTTTTMTTAATTTTRVSVPRSACNTRLRPTRRQPQRDPQLFSLRNDTMAVSSSPPLVPQLSQQQQQPAPPLLLPPQSLLHHVLGLRENHVEVVAPGESAHCERTLAYALFGNRVRTIKINLNQSSTNLPITSVEADGSKYELLSVKLQKRASGGGFSTRQGKQIQAQYILTEPGPLLRNHIRTINLQTELEQLANFSQLTTGKVAARLELLQSTACINNKKPLIVHDLTSDDFEEITEVAHEGCGFMPIG